MSFRIPEVFPVPTLNSHARKYRVDAAVRIV